ncbi:hypothetical protein RJ640_014377 [Escallonia rubra]|uniref:C2H2-type domain-containing protein n=1 Tax=Escallonia rubra TaxID=112253 RepID=A0AA88QKE9_9ASTE|nr:hypothetical protein RJ640_014377 [Escallonia rubra]
MEINQSSTERSEQLIWSSEEPIIRSYTCTFCQKGFSNAQALGGHMNIHRKDRARLKETSSHETLLSLDITKSNSTFDHPDNPTSEDEGPLQKEASDEKSCTLKRPWIFSEVEDASPRKKDGNGEPIQLPLFGEAPSSSGHEKMSMELRHISSRMELDLELRLGPEPEDTSTKNCRGLS